MKEYFLMRENVPCGQIAFNDNFTGVEKYKDFHTGRSPFLGNADLSKIKVWWKQRAAPGRTTSEYLAENLALSVTDRYWINPTESPLSYKEISKSAYDRNASLGGRMEKHWDFSGPRPALIKESDSLQTFNEAIATLIHTRQNADIPFVRYTAHNRNGHGICTCVSFVCANTEYLSAYEVLESAKGRNDRSLYRQYIDLCVQNGIDRSLMQDFMDYQTLTDFLISNTDRHLLNFGILRDANTLSFLSPAPIFDSGNSMFYNETRAVPYTKAQLLARPITSFYKAEEKMLANVQNRGIVKADLLPTPAEMKSLYLQAGATDQKAAFISGNYERKIQMFEEFQRGKTISLYGEKQREAKPDDRER